MILLEPIQRGVIFIGNSFRYLLDTLLSYFLTQAKVTLDMTVETFSGLAEEAILFQENIKKQALSFQNRIMQLILLYISVYFWIWIVGLFHPRIGALLQGLFCLYVAYQVGLLQQLALSFFT